MLLYYSTCKISCSAISFVRCAYHVHGWLLQNVQLVCPRFRGVFRHPSSASKRRDVTVICHGPEGDVDDQHMLALINWLLDRKAGKSGPATATFTSEHGDKQQMHTNIPSGSAIPMQHAVSFSTRRNQQPVPDQGKYSIDHASGSRPRNFDVRRTGAAAAPGLCAADNTSVAHWRH